MAFNFGKWLPYIIGGGASVGGAVIGSRASGKAAETSAQASEAAAETQLTMSREQLAQLREIYGIDLSLNWPRHRLATESLGNLARGMGSNLPPSAFETTDAPPELPGAGGPGAPGTGAGEHGSDPLDPNSPAYHPIQTPPGRGPSGKGSVGGGAASGAGLGATIGSVVPGVGTAIGAGVGAFAGAVSGLFGRGRREADHINPSQEELTRRIGIVGGELSRRIGDGTVTDQDWTDAAQIVRDLRDQYYEFSDEYKRAGPGARTTMDGWLNPMLDAWDKRALNWVSDWTTWEYDPNAVWSPPPVETGENPPSRRFGGPVGGTLSAMAKKQQRPEYLVGEVGPEMYVDEQGNSSMVGMGGPQMFTPPRDGYIVPNHDLGQRGAITLSDLGNGTYGMPPKQRMLGGPGRGRYMGSRARGGKVRSPFGATGIRKQNLKTAGNSCGGVPKPGGSFPGQEYFCIDGRWILLDEGYVPPTETPADPGGTDPGGTDPGGTDPGGTDPGGTDPGGTDPGNSCGGVPKPGGSFPGQEYFCIDGRWILLDEGYVPPTETPADPGGTDPGGTDPGGTDPGGTDPGGTDPGGTDPGGEGISGQMVEDLAGWGWNKQADGTWLHDNGYRAYQVGSKLVSQDQDIVFDTAAYRADPSNESAYTSYGISDDLAAQNPWSDEAHSGRSWVSQSTVQRLNELGWQRQPDGSWMHDNGTRAYQVGAKLVAPENDYVIDIGDYLDDPSNPSAYLTHGVSDDLLSHNSLNARNPIQVGEFTDPNPNQGRFSSGPAPEPFSYAPGEQGYQPLNEEFSFTTQEYQVPPGMRKELKAWGWEELPDGTWLHDDGYEARLVGDKLVSDEQDVVFDISDYMDTAGDPNRFEDVSKFQTEGVPDALKGLRPHAGYQALNKKFEFDTEDLLKDPGYQFRQDEGAKAIERKGAARGMLQSGRTLQSLSNFSQGLASQEYGQAYGRSLGEFGIRERQTLNAYDRAEKEFGMRRGQSLNARDRAFQEWGAKYGMYGDSYNRDLQEYENERDEWRWGDERRWGRTLALAGQ